MKSNYELRLGSPRGIARRLQWYLDTQVGQIKLPLRLDSSMMGIPSLFLQGLPFCPFRGSIKKVGKANFAPLCGSACPSCQAFMEVPFLHCPFLDYGPEKTPHIMAMKVKRVLDDGDSPVLTFPELEKPTLHKILQIFGSLGKKTVRLFAGLSGSSHRHLQTIE